MNNFWIGSGITLMLVAPVIIFFALANNKPTVATPTSDNVLEQPGALPEKIFTVNDKCIEEISNPSSGVISSECMNYETTLTNDFMDKITQEVSNDESITCAKNLPKDLKDLDKKIEGNRAQVIIEGSKIVEGKEEETEDLQVEFIRTEDDWEISDIRCLN